MASRSGTQKEATMVKEVRIGALKLKFLVDDKVSKGKATMLTKSCMGLKERSP
jgi:hypothetical protein